MRYLTNKEYEKIWNTIKESKDNYHDYEITFTFDELKYGSCDETIIEAMKQVDSEDNDYETLYVEITDELEDTIREIAVMDPYDVDWKFIGNDTIKISYRVWKDEAE